MPHLNALGEDLDEEHDVSEREIDQAIIDLDHFGVFEYNAWYGLLRRELISASGKWFKPIPWSINYANVNELGRKRRIRAQVDDLANPESERLLIRDLFQPNQIGPRYTGHLVFSTVRIKKIIAEGHYRELARVCHGDAIFLGDDKQKNLAHPDIFPLEKANA